MRVLDAAGFPAYYRVVWNEHSRELSELARAERAHCIDAVVEVERVLLARLAPAKVNLAALGNLVPHLHWHVVARFEWDSHFPQPIWGERQRDFDAGQLERLARALPAIDAEIGRAVLELEA